MPSVLHQALVALFRNRPTLATELLSQALGAPVPAFQDVRFESPVLEDAVPAEYRADLVEVLVGAAPVLAIVVEVQLTRKPRKRFTWPVYLAALRARLRCPAVLLVVAPRPAIARWAARPIELGHPGWVLRPMVVGPAAVPEIVDPVRAAQTPELAVLSAIAHGRGARGLDIALAVVAAAAGLDDERARLYADLAVGSLGQAAKRALEEMMESGKYEYQSDFARKYFSKGKEEGIAQGRAEALLAVLEARSLEVSAEARARILACNEPGELDQWLRRAATAPTIQDVFE
jgi:hypothetical protein